MNIKNQRGQTLVEMMIASSLMIIGLLGVFSVLSQSLGINRIAGNQYIAANLASEGIEVIKNIIDTNAIIGQPWNNNVSTNGTFGVQYDSTTLNSADAYKFLYYYSSSGIYSYNTSIGKKTNFKRTITINNISADEIRVNSRVEWKDRGGSDFNVDVESHFYNWREEI